MTDFYVSIQIVGTPDDCIQQMGELQRLTGTDHIVCDFSYGRMPHHESELNMRLFAREALPTLQRDAAFEGQARTPARSEQRRAGKECDSPCSSRWGP